MPFYFAVTDAFQVFMSLIKTLDKCFLIRVCVAEANKLFYFSKTLALPFSLACPRPYVSVESPFTWDLSVDNFSYP